MSATTLSGGADRRNAPRRKRSERPLPKRDWIGVDFADFATRQPSRALLPLLVLALIVALGVAALRIDLIRTRYALAAAMDEEKALIKEQHALIVEKLQGRDPIALAQLARERGFRPARAVVSLVDPIPMPDAKTSGLEAFAVPSVAAGPPDTTAKTANTEIEALAEAIR